MSGAESESGLQDLDVGCGFGHFEGADNAEG